MFPEAPGPIDLTTPVKDVEEEGIAVLQLTQARAVGPDKPAISANNAIIIRIFIYSSIIMATTGLRSTTQLGNV